MSSVEVLVADEQADVVVDAARWRELARAVLAAEGVTGDVELSLVFVDAAAMAELNEVHMAGSGPTDVLAFPIDDSDALAGPRLLGDVVVCPKVAAIAGPANAGSYPGHRGTTEDELALLVVHGILHVLGMDHTSDDQRALMQQREREHLAAHYGAVES